MLKSIQSVSNLSPMYLQPVPRVHQFLGDLEFLELQQVPRSDKEAVLTRG